MNKFKEMAKTFREIADMSDELAALQERGESGEDVDKEFNAAVGQFMLKYMELSK